MSRPRASEFAEALEKATGHPALVGFAIDDMAGGVFVEAGYTVSVEDAEYLAATVLRDIRRQMEAEPHPCDGCRKRMERITKALAALEMHGSRPTGQVRGEPH